MHSGWIYLRLGWLLVLLSRSVGTARPRFDTSTDMGLVLVPADAEVDSVIFRLRATDQDADFPLVFDVTATVTPIVRIENLPCTLYNKICQANVILTKRLVPGRLHDFAVRVKDSKGDSDSMQATISVTNATTQRDQIFPHIPALIMVPENAKPGKELDYILVRSNQWSGKPVYIELWQPKELFTIRQRQSPAETRGVITLIGELDFETQSMHTLKIYATDPYTQPRKDTRNIAGLHLVVVVQDVQDVPPIFTLAPPLTKINNTVQPGDIILRVHAEDGDKGVPREVTYGLVSEGNPFTPFFNISETTGEITLARPLEELTLITHVGAPVVLSVVAEEIRRSPSEPPAQATVVEVGLLLGEPGNSPPFFENDNYVAWMDENAEPGSLVNFTDRYVTRVRDEDIGKAGVFALKLHNNNGTFEINPAVAERIATFAITVRDNDLIDYEKYKSLRFEIIAQEVGPATNLSATVPCTIFIRDVNDNQPEFDLSSYEVTLSEDTPAGTRVLQVHATDRDTGLYGRIQYTRIIGPGSECFVIDRDTGIITVAMGNTILDREITASFQLSVEARDEDGEGLRGIVPLIVNLIDVNDNAPIFQKSIYEFTLNEDLTNFTAPAIVKAEDADAEPPNNEVRYELVHGNYENKFYLDEISGELYLREPINSSRIRRTRHDPYRNFASKIRYGVVKVRETLEKMTPVNETRSRTNASTEFSAGEVDESVNEPKAIGRKLNRRKREIDDTLFTLTARAYDLGVPHLSSVTQVKVIKGPVVGARIVSFVVPGENPDPVKTAETLAAITGGHITVQDIRPYTITGAVNGSASGMPVLEGEKKSIVVARVEPNRGGTSLVDIERIRAALAANGVGVIGGGMPGMETGSETKSKEGVSAHGNTKTYTNVTTVHSEEVTVYKAENRLLFWLLMILGLLMLLALIALIVCCICPGCPFYMAPRKRRVHSSETLIARSDGRPKRHLHRKHPRMMEGSWPDRKQAWSADPVRHNWQFNRRNQKGGLASLPGDVRDIGREQSILEKAGSLRDGAIPYATLEQPRRPDERIYIEDVEGLRARGYADVDYLRNQDEHHQRHYLHQEGIQERPIIIREQRFYRDGNAEVLRLETREQVDEPITGNRPRTLVIEQTQAFRNGKDILLQRFIEDQKQRVVTEKQDFHDSYQDIERRSVPSPSKDTIALQQSFAIQQPAAKIVLLPERLEDDHRRHIEELGPEVQRLIIDHGSFERSRHEPKSSQEILQPTVIETSDPKISDEGKPIEDTSKQRSNFQRNTVRDLELARQNALLTRVLLGRDIAPGLIDSASYLETQSLPGQVAIATQTDRTAATQTEIPNRSRSDNDESEEEAKIRKKLKYKKRYVGVEPKRTIRTLWMKSPIEEEEMRYGEEKKTIFLRKKMRDVKDNRRISIEPDVLREISDSLDENGEPPEKSKPDVSKVRKEEHRRESSSPEVASEDTKKTIKIDMEIDENGRQRDDRENIVEPSFRILEKEMNTLSKKLSKLAGKKFIRADVKSSNFSETDSLDMGNIRVTKKTDGKTDPTDTKKSFKDIGLPKKRSKSHRILDLEKLRSKIDAETREISRAKKNQTISTGSSDLEDIDKKKLTLKPSGKYSHFKSIKRGKSENKEPTKITLDAPKETRKTKEIFEAKESSENGSKESMKSKTATTLTKTDEGQCSLTSASSDSSKDKKVQKKTKPTLVKMSVVESEEKIDSQSIGPTSDRTGTKKFHSKDKILNRRGAPEIKTESERSTDLISSDDTKITTLRGKSKSTFDRKKNTDFEGKTVIQRSEKIETSGRSSDSLESDDFKNGTEKKQQSEEKTKLNESIIDDSRKTEFQGNEENQLESTIETTQKNGRSTLRGKSAVEITDAKKESGSTTDIDFTTVETFKQPQQCDSYGKETPEFQKSPELQKSPEFKKSPELQKSPEFKKSPELKKSPEFQKSPESLDTSTRHHLGEQTSQMEETKIPSRKISPREAQVSLRNDFQPDNLKINQTREKTSISRKADTTDGEGSELLESKLIEPLEKSILETTDEKLEKVIEEEIPNEKSIISKKDSFEGITDRIPEITKEGIEEFLSREVKSGKKLSSRPDEKSDEIEEIQSSENYDSYAKPEASKSPSEENQTQTNPNKDEKEVSRESDDSRGFSDNFESFHKIKEKSKDSLDSQNSENEIPYETLPSESSDERIRTKEKIVSSVKIEDTTESDKKPAENKKSEKVTSFSVVPEIAAFSDFSSSRIVNPNKPKQTEKNLIKPIESSLIPDLSKSEIGKKELKTTPDISYPKYEEKTPATSADDFPSEKSIYQTPIIPLLEIKPDIEKDVTETEFVQKSIKSRFPSTSDLSESTLAIHSPKEYGIADSLFTEAKILSAPSSPKVLSINLEELSRAMLDDTESDSSETSGKTMTTARPYGTPRQRKTPKNSKTAEIPSETTTPPAVEDKPVLMTESPKRSIIEIKELPASPKIDPNIEIQLFDEQNQPKEEKRSSLVTGSPERKIEISGSPERKIETSGSPEKKIETSGSPERKIKISGSPEGKIETSGSPVRKIESSGSPRRKIETSGSPEKKIETSGSPVRKIETTGSSDKESEISAELENRKDVTTDKVQLSQSRQTKFTAESYGFVSLPETESPAMSTKYSTISPSMLAEQTQTLSGDKTARDDLGISTSDSAVDLPKLLKMDISEGTSEEFPPKASSYNKPEVRATTENLQFDESKKTTIIDYTDNVKTEQTGKTRFPIEPKQTQTREDKKLKKRDTKEETPILKKVGVSIKTDLPKKSQFRKIPKEDKPKQTQTNPNKSKEEKTTKVITSGMENQAKSLARINRVKKLRKTKLLEKDATGNEFEKGKKSLKDEEKKSAGKQSEKSAIRDKEQSKYLKTIVASKFNIESKPSAKNITQTNPNKLPSSSASSRKSLETEITETEETTEEISSEVSPSTSGKLELPESTGMEDTRPKDRTTVSDAKEQLPADVKVSELLISGEESKMVIVDVPEMEKPLVGPKSMPEIEKPPILQKSTPEIEKPPIVQKSTSEIEKPPIVQKSTPEIEKPPIVEKSTSEIEKPPIVEKSTPEIEKPPILQKSTPEIEKPPIVQKSTPEIEKPPILQKSTPEIEKPPIVQKSTPEIEKPPILQKSTPEIEKPPIVEKSTSEIEKPPIVEKSTPEMEKAPIVQKSMPEIEKPPILQKSIPEIEKSPIVQKSTPETEKPLNIQKSTPETTDKPSLKKPQKCQKLKPEIQKKPIERRSQLEEDKSLKPLVTVDPTSPRKVTKARKEHVPAESQSRYMEWYKLNREEMERKRQDRKQSEEEGARPKWLRKSTRQRWIKLGPEDKKNFDPKITDAPLQRRKIKPLVNVESEQLRAIVRQGRMLRKARGDITDEPEIQIFAPEHPPPTKPEVPASGCHHHHHHHLIQHSEYKYEKIPSEIYLHRLQTQTNPNINKPKQTQTILDTATQTSSQSYQDYPPDEKYTSLPMDSRYRTDIYDSGNRHRHKTGKLRHADLLEKMSVFDIAYCEAATPPIRSDSTTPPS